MSHQNLKLSLIIGFALFILAGLLGGQFLYEKYVVDGPLQQSVRQISQGNDVLIVKKDGKTIVKISPVPTGDLKALYQAILEKAEQEYGSNVDIEFMDQSDEFLLSVWNDIQFPIYEGIATGEYTRMQEKSIKLLEDKNLQGNIKMDRHRIYIQLSHEDKYLYRVLQYSERGVKA